jgi:magnesium transporter
MQLLAGVGDGEISDNVLTTVRGRATWLVVNLVTAILASLVIGLFDATIEQMVALRSLCHQTSMGDNADRGNRPRARHAPDQIRRSSPQSQSASTV